MAPDQYRALPKGWKCKCPALWKEADGSYWCCNASRLEELEHERHSQEMQALEASNSEPS